MKAILGVFSLLTLCSAASGGAQARDAVAAVEDLETRVQAVVEQSGVLPALESVVTEVGPELQQALARLAVTLAGFGERMANDPELRESTLRGAEGMVEVAQGVVEERSDLLIEVLRSAAEQLEQMSRRAQAEAAAKADAEGQ